MGKEDILNQFSWVMKVLESCQTPQQVETAQKLFELYLKKWDKDMTDQNIQTLKTHFEKETKNKVSRVRKKRESFLSKASQFFLF